MICGSGGWISSKVSFSRIANATFSASPRMCVGCKYFSCELSIVEKRVLAPVSIQKNIERVARENAEQGLIISSFGLVEKIWMPTIKVLGEEN